MTATTLPERATHAPAMGATAATASAARYRGLQAELPPEPFRHVRAMA